jgi:diguanylate cyclase
MCRALESGLKSTRIVKCWLAGGALLVASLSVSAGNFTARLEQADAVRTSNAARFDSLLRELEREKAHATPREREYLRLLVDYQRVLRGDYETALGDAVALQEQAEATEIRFRAALLAANTAGVAREFLLGLRYLERALGMRGQLADSPLRHSALTVAGTLYNQYGQFALGRQYAEQALAEEGVPSRIRCIAGQIKVESMHGLGIVLDEAGDVQTAIQACSAIGERMVANGIRSTLAHFWAAKGKHRQAIALLEAHLPAIEATAYPWLIGEVHSQLAAYRLELGEDAASELHAKRAVELAGGAHAGSIITAHQVLYRLALKRGDHRRALDEYRKYSEAEKARLDDVKAREYAFQLSRHEMAQKNHSIELLRNQNQLLRLQQEVAEKNKSNSQLLIALLVVLASSLGYWGWRGRRMHRTLRQLAQTDSLTGLANRRHFREQSEALLLQARQQGRPLSLLLFDLDHFKQINDQCGHATGDWVLKEVAGVGRIHCRPGDVFGRIGGEEFAVALVDCDLGDAEIIAERMREAIAAIDGRASGCPLPVSASVGCVTTSVSGHEYETLVAHADAAMYRSKVDGRNRISRYQTASITPVPVRLESVPVASPEAMRAS